MTTTLSMSAAAPRCFAVGSRAQSGGARKATTAGRTARVSRARGASLVARAAFTPAGAKIAGVGMAVPTQYLTNDDLSELVDTNDEWIQQRTGIKERRYAADGVATSDLALEASKQAGLKGWSACSTTMRRESGPPSSSSNATSRHSSSSLTTIEGGRMLPSRT